MADGVEARKNAASPVGRHASGFWTVGIFGTIPEWKAAPTLTRGPYAGMSQGRATYSACFRIGAPLATLPHPGRFTPRAQNAECSQAVQPLHATRGACSMPEYRHRHLRIPSAHSAQDSPRPALAVPAPSTVEVPRKRRTWLHFCQMHQTVGVSRDRCLVGPEDARLCWCWHPWPYCTSHTLGCPGVNVKGET